MPEVKQTATAELAEAIVGAVNASQGPKKIGHARYMRERSLHRGKGFLARKVFQNGIEVSEDQISKDAIAMLNALEPGNYAEGLVQVIPTRAGDSMSGIDIVYSNKTVDERIRFATRFPSFEILVSSLLKERRDAVTA